MGAGAGSIALLYPFVLYFLKDRFSPLYLVYALLIFLLTRALVPFILSPKMSKTPLQKNTLLLTVGVAGILTVLSVFQGDIAALYYPVIMSLALGSAFFLSLLFPPSLIELLARLQEPALSPAAVIYTRNVTKVWVGFCLLNAVLSYTTVRSGNLEIWTLYNGVISYGLMGILLGGEFLFRTFYKKSQHKKAFENFTPLSHLHQKKEKDWAAYWQSQETVCRHYPAYIAALTLQIKASKMKRIFLISEDRALFLAGFLSTLQAEKTLVLPSSHKPDLLKSLLKKDDLILSDQNNLNSLDCPFIALDKIKPLETFHRAKRINPEKAGIIFYTSGSSGTPKPIGKNLSQLENEVKELQKTWPLKPNRNTALFSTVPHHHLYGLLFSLLWPARAPSS